MTPSAKRLSISIREQQHKCRSKQQGTPSEKSSYSYSYKACTRRDTRNSNNSNNSEDAKSNKVTGNDRDNMDANNKSRVNSKTQDACKSRDPSNCIALATSSAVGTSSKSRHTFKQFETSAPMGGPQDKK